MVAPRRLRTRKYIVVKTIHDDGQYEQFRPGIFRIATLNRWIVVVCGTKFVEELRKAPDTDVSYEEALNDVRCVLG